MSIRASNGAAGAAEQYVEFIITELALFNFDRVWSTTDALMQTLEFKLIDSGKDTPDVIEFELGNGKSAAYA